MSINAAPISLQRWPTATDPVIAYAEWRMSCTSVWAAYRQWSRAPSADAGLAHAAYTAREASGAMATRPARSISEGDWITVVTN